MIKIYMHEGRVIEFSASPEAEAGAMTGISQLLGSAAHGAYTIGSTNALKYVLSAAHILYAERIEP